MLRWRHNYSSFVNIQKESLLWIGLDLGYRKLVREKKKKRRRKGGVGGDGGGWGRVRGWRIITLQMRVVINPRCLPPPLTTHHIHSFSFSYYLPNDPSSINHHYFHPFSFPSFYQLSFTFKMATSNIAAPYRRCIGIYFAHWIWMWREQFWRNI